MIKKAYDVGIYCTCKMPDTRTLYIIIYVTNAAKNTTPSVSGWMDT